VPSDAILKPDIHVPEKPSVPAAPAAPEMPTIRFPEKGQVAFVVPLMPGWKSHPDPTSEMLMLTAPDRSIAISLDIVEDDAAGTVSPQDMAQKLFEHVHASETPQPPMTFAGLQTEVFAGPLRNQKGADVNMRLLIAKIDERHLAIVSIDTLKDMTTQQEHRLNSLLNGIQITR
jgi:hypothetical protein